jgi:hypothetical protein
MASSALAIFSTIAAVEAGTLAVTWSDCGAKHATVTDLEPTTIQTGTTERLTGTGTVDEDVTSAHFTAKVSSAGVQLTSCEGDATADIDCNLPLGAGTITVKQVAYPIAKGTTNIAVDVKTSSVIPASLAKVDVAIRATEQNGEDVICLDVHTEKKLSASADEPCCKTCEAPLEKYHSVDVPHGFCGEACMDPSKFNIYKIFEKNLTKSDSDTPCAEQFTPTGTHYTEYSETVTHGVPGLLAVTLDLYGPGPELSSSADVEDNTCSADIGHCGKAYQACCITYGAQGYPCGCSLSDGQGSSVGDCGTCGAAYQICCDSYKADGFPCNCDVRGAGLFTV